MASGARFWSASAGVRHSCRNCWAKRVLTLGRDHPDFVTALERGLAVIQCFDAEHRSMTLAEVSVRPGLSRGTARRFLLTLAELGFVAADNGGFSLTPRVMRLGYAFLSSLGIGEIAEPIIRGLGAQLDETVSLAVLDGEDVVFLARAEARRVYRTNVTVGARLPAHATSLGRVLLAGLPDAELAAWLERVQPVAYTPKTIMDKDRLMKAILQARQDGFATMDEELQIGIRSVAVPVPDRDGSTLAALNIGGLTPQTSLAVLRNEFVPLLRAAAAEIAGSRG